MIVVGIVGGIASGKSLVTEQLESLGAVVLDVDRIGHEVLRDPLIKDQIRRRWSEAVFSADNEVNRQALAQIVFDPANSGELEALENITHPQIEERLRQQIEQVRAANQSPMLVLDAAILVKTGWHRLCDEILFVEATLENRHRRAERRGWSPQMLAQREARQAPLETKRAMSTVQIDNNGTLEATQQQIHNFWNRHVSNIH